MAARQHLTLPSALKWRLVQLAAVILGWVPSLARLSPLFGDIAHALSPTAVANVEDNLHHALPLATQRSVRRNARGVFRNLARYYCVLLTLPRTDVARLHASVEVEGYEHFLAGRSGGRGVIVASVHCGPTEIVLQAFAARGVYYTAMVERIRPWPLAAFLKRLRGVYGQRYVYPDREGVKACLRALRSGGVVALLVERDVVGSGVPVRFLGGTVRAPIGLLPLARAANAAIVPAAAHWRPEGGIHVTFWAPMTPDPRERGHTHARVEAAALLARFEQHIRAHPDQWLVLERLFLAGV